MIANKNKIFNNKIDTGCELRGIYLNLSLDPANDKFKYKRSYITLRFLLSQKFNPKSPKYYKNITHLSDHKAWKYAYKTWIVNFEITEKQLIVYSKEIKQAQSYFFLRLNKLKLKRQVHNDKVFYYKLQIKKLLKIERARILNELK